MVVICSIGRLCCPPGPLNVTTILWTRFQHFGRCSLAAYGRAELLASFVQCRSREEVRGLWARVLLHHLGLDSFQSRHLLDYHTCSFDNAVVLSYIVVAPSLTLHRSSFRHRLCVGYFSRPIMPRIIKGAASKVLTALAEPSIAHRSVYGLMNKEKSAASLSALNMMVVICSIWRLCCPPGSLNVTTILWTRFQHFGRCSLAAYGRAEPLASFV